KNPDYISSAKDVGRYLLFVAIAAYLFFAVLRPLMRNAFQPAPSPAQAEGGSTAALHGPHGEVALAGPAGSRDDPLQYARELSREDPKVVATVVKSWVNKDG